jgi:hypothetical protein
LYACEAPRQSLDHGHLRRRGLQQYRSGYGTAVVGTANSGISSS